MANTIKLKRGTSTPTTSDIVNGEVAIDTSAQKLFVNDGGTVKEIGGGSSVPTGGGSDKVFFENAKTVTTNYTIGDTFGAACNAMAAGPLTINSGVTITIDSGDTLTIVWFMKEIIEKQILEWQQEIINQRQYLLKLEGGVQAYQLLLKEINKPKEVKENIKK